MKCFNLAKLRVGYKGQCNWNQIKMLSPIPYDPLDLMGLNICQIAISTHPYSCSLHPGLTTRLYFQSSLWLDPYQTHINEFYSMGLMEMV